MTESRKLRVVLFKSRNKDNRQLSGFKERVVNFVSTRSNGELVGEFEHFAQQGLPGELSRMYVSANARSNDKVQKSLVSHLVEHDDVNMATLPQLVASKASLSKNRAESKWLFDYDDSFDNLFDFLEDVEHYSKGNQSSARHIGRQMALLLSSVGGLTLENYWLSGRMLISCAMVCYV